MTQKYSWRVEELRDLPDGRILFKDIVEYYDVTRDEAVGRVSKLPRKHSGQLIVYGKTGVRYRLVKITAENPYEQI